MKRITPIVLLAILTACGSKKSLVPAIRDTETKIAQIDAQMLKAYQSGDEKYLSLMMEKLRAESRLDSLKLELAAR
jgi:hypothetical protein